MKLEEIKNDIFNKKDIIKKIINYFEDDLVPQSGRPYECIDDVEVFFTIISLGSAQAKSPEVEKFLERKLEWKRIPPSKNCGDFYDKKKYGNIELKVSFPNKQNSLNFRQVRLWQPIDYYIGIYIDEDNIFNSLVFVLTHEEMKNIILEKGSATHGTKEANSLNKNIEYSYSLDLSNEKLVQEWKNKYFNIELYNAIFRM